MKKLLHYENFLVYQEDKRTTLISTPIPERNNQAPSRNNINLKQATTASQDIKRWSSLKVKDSSNTQ